VEVVHLVNRLDASNATEVRQELESLMNRGCHRLALNLDRVSFVDSTGLSVFVHAVKAARAAGGNVNLIHPSPAVRSVLELTRLSRIMEIWDDESSAVLALAQ
jgi:anti-sigma B factor antagonist